MLPALLLSLIFCRKSPASCSSSSEWGIFAWILATNSRASPAWVVFASSLSGWFSEASLRSLSSGSSSGGSGPRSSFRRMAPMVVSVPSKASMPLWTSKEAVSLALWSFSSFWRCTRFWKLTSKFSRVALTFMFCSQCWTLFLIQSSLATLFCRMRSRRPNLWISRCSAMWACSSLSISKATTSCLSISCS